MSNVYIPVLSEAEGIYNYIQYYHSEFIIFIIDNFMS